jgi:adenine phosphoribosyltransferase
MGLPDLKSYIRDVPDFPKPGIVFKDITPLLRNAAAFDAVIGQLTERYAADRITQVAAIESRGFIFGSAIARALGAGFVPIRKPGKLPWTKRRNEYILEYGSDALEIHDDAIEPDDRVLIIDDVLATGGTALAASTLVREFNATLVGVGVVIELVFLGAREKLGGATPVQSLIRYE